MLINGNCLYTPFADKSFHMIVTSPPYWMKRKYEGLEGPMVFGGDKECEHEWEARDYYLNGGGAAKITAESFSDAGDENAERIKAARWQQDVRCKHCGAWHGNLGQEPEVDMFVDHLVEVFREMKRILRKDGVCWVNLGDTFNSTPSGFRGGYRRAVRGSESMRGRKRSTIIQKQNLCGVPWRFALAMQADGWHLKRDIVWEKQTPMPESVNGVRWEKCKVKVKIPKRGKEKYRNGTFAHKPQNDHDGKDFKRAEYEDCPGCEKCLPNGGLVLRRGSWRPSTSHEYIFMFTKSEKYFCDAEAVREPLSPKTLTVKTAPRKGNGTDSAGERFNLWREQSGNGRRSNLAGANMKSVLRFSVENLNDEHYAAFPSSLPAKFIKASTSDKGCCAKCGAQIARIVEIAGGTKGHAWHDHKDDNIVGMRDTGRRAANGYETDYRRETIGWKPTCNCEEFEVVPCRVFDPFMGSGRTAVAAIKLGRNWAGLDLSMKYCRLAQRQLHGAMQRNGSMIVSKHKKQLEIFG